MSRPEAKPAAPTPPPAHEAAARRDWPAYFARMEGNPPRETLVRAAEALAARSAVGRASSPSLPLLAADIGCGSGRDAEELLNRGFRVWAQDAHPEALARLGDRPACAAAIAEGRLTLVDADFADTHPPRAALVNASFSLPFCPPAHFPALWARIDAAIEPGGYFAGQFFGDRDDWSILEDRTHLTREQVFALFPNYVLEFFREEDRPSTYTAEHHKHWHVFHIVARKREEA